MPLYVLNNVVNIIATFLIIFISQLILISGKEDDIVVHYTNKISWNLNFALSPCVQCPGDF